MKHLYPFQVEGAEALRRNRLWNLWDEPGLGKTVQALAALDPSDVVLVVCPAVVKGVWEREARDAGWEVNVLRRRTPIEDMGLAPSRIVVCNPEILEDGDQGLAWRQIRLVLDEAHMYKSPKAQRTKKVRTWIKNVTRYGGSVWQLTGTPILNRPLDLWHLLSNLGQAEQVFGGWNQFLRLFRAKQDHWGRYEWGVPDPSLPSRLAQVSTRRTRAEVLPDLPTKTYERVDVRLSHAHEHEVKRMCTTFDHIDVDDDELFEILTLPGESEQVSTLRRLLAESKMPDLGDLLDMLEEESDDPVVVFSDHRAPCFHAATRSGWACITGDTPAAERTLYEEAFQRGELRGLAGTIGAMGVGLTLTRAHRVVFVDRSFTPALNSQAEDRCCRIGQDRGVIVTDLVSSHKVDQALYRLLVAKQTIADRTLTVQDVFEFVDQSKALLKDRPQKRGKKWHST